MPPNNGEGNIFQIVEGKYTSEIHSRKYQQDYDIGTKHVDPLEVVSERKHLQKNHKKQNVGFKLRAILQGVVPRYISIVVLLGELYISQNLKTI